MVLQDSTTVIRIVSIFLNRTTIIVTIIIFILSAIVTVVGTALMSSRCCHGTSQQPQDWQ